ncbi:PREDICTED: zinc finger BED domain-containing protein 1-like [Amphimedon queenslandica]|uniref:Uncharacterized protein n=1 Tax=Amphimedon queenslandica TaxID=400682 RepID=A0A1X7VUK3_AMPQE|nr:PREDICTED: zinc finger BED domain-containing protein 1-like [Amphimedon queenslandica]|eukprot:XP_019854457.1 PREDICTED: zinc finger BED domain-containing protein 1-like [Amphimedon queenslandica]
MFADVPKHHLIQDVVTQCNLTYDMIERVIEQQHPISAILLQRRDLIHLEMSTNEWRVLEDTIQLLKPFNVATRCLSGERYPIISALGPLLKEIQKEVTPDANDWVAVKELKMALQEDQENRYIHPHVSGLLHKASFVDPSFKTMKNLSLTQKEEVIDTKRNKVIDTILEEIIQLIEGNS